MNLDRLELLQGDALSALRTLPAESVQLVVTSPPYWNLRSYGLPPQDWPAVEYRPLVGAEPLRRTAQTVCLGFEPDPLDYVAHLVAVFREVRRVLRGDGTLYLNLGDSFAGANRAPGLAPARERRRTRGRPPEAERCNPPVPSIGLARASLVGIPWRVALALQADGWLLRSDVIWSKPNPAPENVNNRPSRAHEHVFLFAKGKGYYYNSAAALEPVAPATLERARYAWSRAGTKAAEYQHVNGLNRPGAYPLRAGGRNRRDVWTIASQRYSGGHFAPFPPALVEPCILTGTPPPEDATPPAVVLDPFAGSGTTLAVALAHGRRAIGIELNPEYHEQIRARIRTFKFRSKRNRRLDAPLPARPSGGQ